MLIAYHSVDQFVPTPQDSVTSGTLLTFSRLIHNEFRVPPTLWTGTARGLYTLQQYSDVRLALKV